MARKTQKKPKKNGGITGLFGSNASKTKASASANRRGQASSGKNGASGSENYLFNLIALVLGLSAIALLAALSSGFSVGASSKPPPNALGDVGQAVSRQLFGTLGASAFLLPPVLAFAGLKIFTSKIPSLKLLQWLGMVLTVLGGMILGHLLVGEAAGGMVGSIATESLKAFIAPLGAGLVATALIIGGLLLATNGALATWTKKALILLWAGLAIALEAIINFLSWVWAEISEQFSNWRAERAEESERSDREAEAMLAEENARLAAIAEAEGFGGDSDIPNSSSPESRLVLQSKVPSSVKPFQSFIAKGALAPAIPIAGFDDASTAQPETSAVPDALETDSNRVGQASHDDLIAPSIKISEPPSDEDDADFFAKTKSQIFRDIRAQEQARQPQAPATPKTPPPKKTLTTPKPIAAPASIAVQPNAPSVSPVLEAPPQKSISPVIPEAVDAPTDVESALEPVVGSEVAIALQSAAPEAETADALTEIPTEARTEAPLEARTEAPAEAFTEIPTEAEVHSPSLPPEIIAATEVSSESVEPPEADEVLTVIPTPAEVANEALIEPSESASTEGILICDPVRLPRINDPQASTVKAAGLDDFGADDEDDLDELPAASQETSRAISSDNENQRTQAPRPATAATDSDEDEGDDEMEDEDQMDGDTSEQANKDPFVFNKKFRLPPLDLLAEPKKDQELQPADADLYRQTAAKLTEKLKTFHIPGEVRRIVPGPVVTRYEFKPGDGIKVSKIAGLGPDLAMAMEALSVRIIAPIPGRDVVGIEVPNKKRAMISIREIFEQQDFQNAKSKLTFAIGKNVEGLPYMTDLAKMPHLLIAGTTGSGKSVTVNAMIMSMLYRATPDEVRMIMVDPKVTELSIYDGIPHLLLPVVTEPKKAAMALQWAVDEMERRYQLLAGASVRNIIGYNAWVQKRTEELKAHQKAAEDAEVALRISRKAKEKRAAGDQASPSNATLPNGGDQNRGGSTSAELDASEMATMIPTSAAEVFGPDMDPSEAKTLPPTAADNLPDASDLPTMIPTAVTSVDDDSCAPTMIPSPAQADDEDDMLFDRNRILSDDEESQYEATVAKFLRERLEEPPQKLPYIVIVIDEVADLMMVVRNEVETHVARLAQKARAAGIHLMMATQRPSADVITGVIKANFPSRISCQLRSWQDSMTILGTKGAEALLGMGDMLILPPDSPNLTRCHGAFVSDQEISDVVAFLKDQGEPNYLDESVLTPPSDDDDEDDDDAGDKEGRDSKYDEALRLISDKKTISTSKLQRWMQIGYNRAARIIDQMEKDGVVGPANGSKPRQVLVPPLDHHNDLNF